MFNLIREGVRFLLGHYHAGTVDITFMSAEEARRFHNEHAHTQQHGQQPDFGPAPSSWARSYFPQENGRD